MSRVTELLAELTTAVKELDDTVNGASPIRQVLDIDRKALEEYAQGLSDREAAVTAREQALESAKADFKASVVAAQAPVEVPAEVETPAEAVTEPTTEPVEETPAS